MLADTVASTNLVETTVQIVAAAILTLLNQQEGVFKYLHSSIHV